jgi:hypothetical protein
MMSLGIKYQRNFCDRMTLRRNNHNYIKFENDSETEFRRSDTAKDIIQRS